MSGQEISIEEIEMQIYSWNKKKETYINNKANNALFSDAVKSKINPTVEHEIKITIENGDIKFTNLAGSVINLNAEIRRESAKLISKNDEDFRNLYQKLVYEIKALKEQVSKMKFKPFDKPKKEKRPFDGSKKLWISPAGDLLAKCDNPPSFSNEIGVFAPYKKPTQKEITAFFKGTKKKEVKSNKIVEKVCRSISEYQLNGFIYCHDKLAIHKQYEYFKKNIDLSFGQIFIPISKEVYESNLK